MKCPYCGFNEDRVVDSREIKNGSSVRRRRECKKCKKRFTTYERVESFSLMVVKKDGRREKFSREKLFSGLRKACEKRPISVDKIEQIVDKIEFFLNNQNRNEIPTGEIGEIVIEELKKLDKVAYIRFASVYREFKDVDEFFDELKKICYLNGESNGREKD